jgi:hypothetical protein
MLIKNLDIIYLCEKKTKQLTVIVSAELYKIIEECQNAVTTAADLVAKVCEQGQKENLGVKDIRKIVFGIFAGSHSERQIRRLLPKSLKNQNMIRDQDDKKDKVKLGVYFNTKRPQVQAQPQPQQQPQPQLQDSLPQSIIAVMDDRKTDTEINTNTNNIIITQQNKDKDKVISTSTNTNTNTNTNTDSDKPPEYKHRNYPRSEIAFTYHISGEKYPQCETFYPRRGTREYEIYVNHIKIKLLQDDGQIITKELNRLPDRGSVIYTYMKCDECNMFVEVYESGFVGWDNKEDPIPTKGAEMLQHLKSIIEDPNNLIAISPKFDKLLTSLRTAYSTEWKLDKDKTEYNDLFDGLRLALSHYKRGD